MDVTSLYTNIPNDDGIAACSKIWEQRTVQEPPTECLLEMLTLVLKTKILLLTFIKLFIAMYPLHVNVIYKPEP
jgi:hypothetical protein